MKGNAQLASSHLRDRLQSALVAAAIRIAIIDTIVPPAATPSAKASYAFAALSVEAGCLGHALAPGACVAPCTSPAHQMPVLARVGACLHDRLPPNRP